MPALGIEPRLLSRSTTNRLIVSRIGYPESVITTRLGRLLFLLKIPYLGTYTPVRKMDLVWTSKIGKHISCKSRSEEVRRLNASALPLGLYNFSSIVILEFYCLYCVLVYAYSMENLKVPIC
jgi:hypothetical protein